MPLYEYLCLDCHCLMAEKRPVDERDEETICDFCGGVMKRQRTVPMVNVGHSRDGDEITDYQMKYL